MAQNIKLLVIAGARPNFMKIAPLIHAIQHHSARRSPEAPAIDYVLVHTGQHYDSKMSDIFFEELRIPPPHINLEVGSGSHAVQTASVMTKFEPVCQDIRPDWVVVVGDVNSTMACTLVATKLGAQVAHIEAGLRSYDRSMPEEINRIVTDALADMLLTPSPDADENLKREGIAAAKIKLVGNIMIDSLLENLPKARQCGVLERQQLEPGGFVYVTLHRPSNVDDQASLTVIMAEMERLSQRLPVVFPIHPRTRKMLGEFGLSPVAANGLHLLEPVGYHDSLCLTENARLVLTDSGGLQEEATFFRTPCLTLRPNTERPITLTCGSNRLTNAGRLSGDADASLNGPARIGQVPPLWDGHTADRILQHLTGVS